MMVQSILLNQSRILPVAAYLEGQYGLSNLYLGVPCRLGKKGIEAILELPLKSHEKEALQKSAASVKAKLQVATSTLL